MTVVGLLTAHADCVAPCWEQAVHPRTGSLLPGIKVSCSGVAIGPRGQPIGTSEGSRTYGYPVIAVRDETTAKKQRTFRLHHVVAATFLPPRPSPLHVVRHHNGIKADCRAENLLWGTDQDNADDAKRLGETPRGTRNSRAKLTEAKVRSIRALYRAGGRTQLSLAEEFGIAEAAVWQVIHRKVWGWLDD